MQLYSFIQNAKRTTAMKIQFWVETIRSQIHRTAD